MEATFIIHIILFVGAAQGFLLSLAIIGIKRGNRTANILLASFIFMFSLIIFFHSLEGMNSNRPEVVSPGDDAFHNLFFVFGPLVYLYVISLTDQSFKFSKKTLLHFVPTILALALDFFLIIFSAPTGIHRIFTPVIVGFVTVQFTIYLYLSAKILIRHSDNLKRSYSSIEKINLDWLRFIIIAQAIIWPFGLFVEIFFHNDIAWNYIWLLVSLFIYLMGYKGLRQPAIFTGVLAGPGDSKDNPPKKKYEKSTLTEELANQYYEKLLNYITSKKIFLEPDLTLPVLANRLGISNHHLSQIINEKEKINFFEFVNRYRVEEAKKMLLDPEKKMLNISAIAFESGFNTLSSFNSVFKKFTAKTPSQFRDNV